MLVKHFLSYVLLSVSILHKAQCSDSPSYVLKKTVQFPGAKFPSSFAVRSDDKILAAQFVQNTTTQTSATFGVYTGELFEKVFHNYDYKEKNVGQIGYSNSGIYTVEGQVIMKYPYLKEREISDSLTRMSVLAIDDNTIAVTAFNSSTNCSFLQVVDMLSDDIKEIHYQSADSGCQEYKAGMLEDLKNGLVAYQTHYVVYILNKKNLTEVIQRISANTTTPRSQSILDVSSFYDRNTNESMLTLRMVRGFNYSIYLLNTTTQQYYKTGEFINYGTKCQYYDINTCITLFNYQLAKMENIHYQNVKNSYQFNQNPFQNVAVLTTSFDSAKVVGYNSKQNNIIIYQIMGNNQFNVNKTINLKDKIPNCISKIEFTNLDKELILEIPPCQNQTLNRICKINIQTEYLKCIVDSQQSSDNHTGIAVIHELTTSNISRLITVRWKLGNQLCFIESRFTDDDLKFQSNYEWKFEGKKIQDVKILYSKSLWKERFTVVLDTDNGSFASHFRLKEDGKIATIEKDLLNTQKLSFNKSVAFKQFIVTMVPSLQYSTLCELHFFNEFFEQISGKRMIFKLGGKNCTSYSLIAQENYKHIMVLNNQYIKGGYVMDFVSIEESIKGYKFWKRSMFVGYGQYQVPQYPFVMPQQQILVAYQVKHYSDPYTPPFRIYNISTIPMFLTSVSPVSWNFNYYDEIQSQFSYTSPISTKETSDEVLAFTYYNYLYMLRNPTQTLSEIEKNNQPDYYVIQCQKTKIYQANSSETITGYSRTILASTNQHLVSIMNTYKGGSIIVFTEIQGKNKGLPVGNQTKETSMVISVDLTKSGNFFMVKQHSYKITPYVYHDYAERYGQGTSSVFEKLFVTSDDHLAYTLKSSANKLIYSLYKDSDLKLDYKNISDNPFDQIRQVKVTPSENAFLVETKDTIQKIVIVNDTKMVSVLNKSSLSSTYVDMFILEAAPNSGIEQRRLVEEKRRVKKQDISSGLTKTSLSNIFSKVRDVFSIRKTNSIVQFSSQTPELDYQYITLIRCQNYVIAYSNSLVDYRIFNDIKITTVFGVSQKGGLIAYVWFDQNQTPRIHVMKLWSFGDRESITNLTMPEVKKTDGSGMYTPTPVEIQFSSSNTICVLTTNNQTNYPPVLYMYFLQGCNSQNSYMDGSECKCLQNYTAVEVSSTSSKVVEMISCQCANNFIQEQSGKCICPTQYKFTFQAMQCLCLNGHVEYDGDLRANVCSRNGPLWILWLVLGLLGGYLIVCAVMKFLWVIWYSRLAENLRPNKCKYVWGWPLYYWCWRQNQGGYQGMA